MTPIHMMLAAATLAVAGGTPAVAFEPSSTVTGTYQIKTQRVCVPAEALAASEREKAGRSRRPCLTRAAWNTLGIWFDLPAGTRRASAS